MGREASVALVRALVGNGGGGQHGRAGTAPHCEGYQDQ